MQREVIWILCSVICLLLWYILSIVNWTVRRKSLILESILIIPGALLCGAMLSIGSHVTLQNQSYICLISFIFIVIYYSYSTDMSTYFSFLCISMIAPLFNTCKPIHQIPFFIYMTISTRAGTLSIRAPAP